MNKGSREPKTSLELSSVKSSTKSRGEKIGTKKGSAKHPTLIGQIIFKKKIRISNPPVNRKPRAHGEIDII